MTTLPAAPATATATATANAPATTHRLGWVLLSPPDRPLPSTRIAALNMMADLTPAGFASELLFAPLDPCEQPTLPPLSELLARVRKAQLDAVIFQKVHGAPVLALASALRTAGVKTMYLVCDLIEPAMSGLTDLTVVVSPYLRGLYPDALRGKVRVVHDGIERPELCKSDHSDHRGSRSQPLCAALVTSVNLCNLADLGLPPPWLRTEVVGPYPVPVSAAARLRAGLRTLSRLDSTRQRLDYLRFATHPRVIMRNWSESIAYQTLLAADIGVIPVDTRPNTGTVPSDAAVPMWMRKSENRLTLKMSLGLPVIASPVPSYLEVIEHGVNAFVARTPREWRDCLDALRSPALRLSVGSCARQAVAERYSRARQATALANVLAELIEGNVQPH